MRPRWGSTWCFAVCAGAGVRGAHRAHALAGAGDRRDGPGPGVDPRRQYFYLRVFDVYIIYLLNLLSVFIVAGIGDDAFLFFVRPQTMVGPAAQAGGARRRTALHDCEGDRKDELSFKKGDVLIVEDEAGDGWCAATARGPGKFAACVAPCEARGASLRSLTAVPDAVPKRATLLPDGRQNPGGGR